jgi:hypothetical protein
MEIFTDTTGHNQFLYTDTTHPTCDGWFSYVRLDPDYYTRLERQHYMSGMFHDDGCVRANVSTRPYQITYEPFCEHTKIRSVVIVVNAESEESAMYYARESLRLPQTRPVLVQEMSEPNQPAWRNPEPGVWVREDFGPAT